MSSTQNIRRLIMQHSFDTEEDKSFTVFVEGNIGCGKTDFMNNLQSAFCFPIEVITEPVDLWSNVGGENLLDLMYSDPVKWGAIFQSYVQLTTTTLLNASSSYKVRVMERSIYSSRYCFIQNFYESGVLPGEDLRMLDTYYKWYVKKGLAKADLVVYLRAKPRTCYDRIRRRKREEESGIQISYVESLHNLHERWLFHRELGEIPAPIIILDAEKSKKEVFNEFLKAENFISAGVV